MAAKIVFTSAVLESFARKPEGGTAQFTSSWNKNVASALGWVDMPDCLSGANLDGDLAASSMELKPSDKELARHVIELDITRVYKFEAVRQELEGKRGKGHRIEVRFKVAFTAPGVCEMLESYMLTIGSGKGSLTVSYQKQQDLGLISEQQAYDTSEASDNIQ